MGVPDEDKEGDPERLVDVGQEVKLPLVPLSPAGHDRLTSSHLPKRCTEWLPNSCRTVAERLPNGYKTVTQGLRNGYRTVTE